MGASSKPSRKAQARQVSGRFHDTLFIQEMNAPSVEIPLWPGIDLAKLTAGDDDPRFVVLPIAEIDAISGNRRLYDESFIQELLRQAQDKKPVGIMGHLSEKERGYLFPAEAVHWIGHIWQGKQLFGKAYVPPGENRQRIARYEATSKKIATSIDAWCDGIWDEAVKATRMLAKTLRLNQIDIAPADRAGISSLSAIPTLATEMEERDQEMPISEAERKEVITEMTVDDLHLLPKPVIDALAASLPVAPEIAIVTELRNVLGVDAKTEIKPIVTEMVQERVATRTAAINQRITELATPSETNAKGIKVDGIRGLVIEMVQSRKPATVADVDRIYGEVIASDHVKAAIKDVVITEMGPNQGGGNPQKQAGEPKFFKLPERKPAPKP